MKHLDKEQVAHDRIGCLAARKGSLGFAECGGVFAPVLGAEHLQQSLRARLADVITTLHIRNHLLKVLFKHEQ